MRGIAPDPGNNCPYAIPGRIGFNNIREVGLQLKVVERSFIRSAGLWRTITLSSLGKTLYPYSQYVRTLDFRVLEKLLKGFYFRQETRK